MFFELVILGVLLFVSVLVSRTMIAYSMRRSIVDIPNERSSHAVPTPRGGGLAIVAVFSVGIMIIAIFYSGLSTDLPVAFIGSGLMAAAVGFWDDHSNVPAKQRAWVHFLAAGWALYWLGGFPTFAQGLSVGVVAGNLFWLIALVWFLNAFNFMDGIDGIAASESIFISSSAALILFLSGSNGLALVSLLLAMATAGFLVWNLPPARIFMGDVGSGFLGLVLGILAIASVREGVATMWVFAILFAVFIADSTVTVFVRIIKGNRWHEAHKSHAYQHAARHLRSHGKVTAITTAINVIWLFPLAIAAWRWPDFGLVFAVVAYIPLVLLALSFGAGREGKEGVGHNIRHKA